ncbi:hypothetical protein LL912_12335 [Niabella sp. CC-SYL272]|uniref:hypothetical protein n=1 Tax=Niabella agricola TaxID=2891571 RepID=UPI001F220D96|nr:hypothetical protein [Niabella agricola]MCF3109560.1 hypothetical protein [Niabella agricola]
MIPIAIIGYTDIYNTELPEDHFSLLRNYPTDWIILYLSKINAILFKEEHVGKQAVAIFEQVFLKWEPQGPKYRNLLNQVLSNGDQAFFSIQSISYLIKASLENFRPLDEHENVDLKVFYKALFDTILIHNTLVYRMDDTSIETHKGLWAIAIRQQNYIRDLNGLIYTGPIKFLLVERYFSQTSEGKEVLVSFQEKMGLGNFWNFAKTFMSLMESALTQSRQGSYILEREDTPPQLLEHFCYKKQDTNGPLTIHMDIIPRPFYEIDNAHLAVLDFSYFRYLLDQGVFWIIYNNSTLRDDSLQKGFNTFQSVVGKHFFEQFLVGNLLKAIYRRPQHILLSDDQFGDFWIKPNHRDIIIVEVKMADINPKTTELFDTEKFENFIRENYAKSKNEKGGAKGVYQLIRQLNLLQSFTPDVQKRLKLQSLKNITVYPIIIYSDSILDAVGVNAFVDEIFQSAKNAHAYSFKINPLTMIGVNNLLDHFKLFYDDANALLSLISDYQKYLIKRRKKYSKAPNAYAFYQQNTSLFEYTSKKYPVAKSNQLENLIVFRNLLNSGHFGHSDIKL